MGQLWTTNTAPIDAAASAEGRGGARRSLFPGILDPRTRDEHPGSGRDSTRALARLTSLLRASRVLSMQEVLDFACGFMDEALRLTSVVVSHDHAAQPLTWAADGADEACVARARAEVEATVARLRGGERSGPGQRWSMLPAEGEPSQVITLPLSIPLREILRVESSAPLHPAELDFLRHAAVLLSLALDRCADGALHRPPRAEPAGEGLHLGAGAGEVELARALAASLERRAARGDEGEGLRLARTMTHDLIHLLETLSGRAR